MPRSGLLGSYLLLKHLGDDDLGGLYRAGLDSDRGIERLVLLRVFEGGAVDPSRLPAPTDSPELPEHPFRLLRYERAQIGGALTTAYAYEPGRTLPRLIEAAENAFTPLTFSQALFVIDRIAQALIDLGETPAPRLHGALTGDQVWVGNDGEVRLLGFDLPHQVASDIAASDARSAVYVAPERAEGGAPSNVDDLYAWGVLAWEALTGQLARPGGGDWTSRIQQAVTAEEQQPLPDELATLLGQCLGPARGRPRSALVLVDRLKALREAESAGPFELAYAVHSVFSTELKEEARATHEGLLTVPEEDEDEPAAGAAPFDAEDDSTSGRPGWLLPTIAASVLGVAAIGYFLFRPQEAPPPPAPAPVVAPAPAPEPPPESAPALSPEDLEAQIASLLAERSEEVTEEISDQYERRFIELQNQLNVIRSQNEAAAAAAEAEAQAPEASEQPDPTPAVETDSGPETGASEAQPGENAAGKPPAPGDEAQAGAAPDAPSTAQPAAPAPTPPAPTPARPAPSQPPPAPAPVVPGSLVTPGPGVEPPQLLRFRRPQYTAIARRSRVEGKVVISALVDGEGKVEDLRFVERIDRSVGLNEEAEQAVRSARFKPATKNGVPVKMWFTITIPFSLD